jgi:predicted alpha/beta-hydrolase family hydrolase
MRTVEGSSSEPAARRLHFQAGEETLSALLLAPASPRVLFVYGHGAGAGMEHPFMEASAGALAERGVATFRYNFPYMEGRRGRPDRAPVLRRVVRAAVEAASAALPGVSLVAGGKSMGGRMTSEAQAEAPLPGVLGLIFVGFPLHRPDRPGVERAEHLARVDLPMLFLQGTRDEMADRDLMHGVIQGLGPAATLHPLEGADHGFHVLKRSGRTDAEVLAELADLIDDWIRDVILSDPGQSGRNRPS